MSTPLIAKTGKSSTMIKTDQICMPPDRISGPHLRDGDKVVVDVRVVLVRDVEGLARVAAGEDIHVHVRQKWAQEPVGCRLLQQREHPQGALARAGIPQGQPTLKCPE